MNWDKLLSPKRIRQLIDGTPSNRSDVETRDEFERDYGRVVFSTPVRRLQDKAQVFPLEEHDAVRTRLTHSLEVASVARNLAEKAAERLGKARLLNDHGRHAHSIGTIAATCGLIHDLGNPPFGHAGEMAMRDWFRKIIDGDQAACALRNSAQLRQDFIRFEGNAQTIRLVGKLQVLTDFHGLNLTCATLSTACKYTAASHETTDSEEYHVRSKPGYFASENQLVSAVRKETGTGPNRHPITFLVEAADDIVYAIVDLEDGLKKRLYNWEELHDELRNGMCGETAVLARIVRKSEDMVKVGPLDDGRDRDEAMSVGFRTFAIAECVAGVLDAFSERAPAIMEGQYQGELTKDPAFSASSLLKACKFVGKKRVYVSDETLRLELMGRRVIHDLMDVFWSGAKSCDPKNVGIDFAGKAYSLISSNYRRVFEKALNDGQLPESYCRLQMVADQIAGMTDSFASTLHARLTNG